MTTVADLPAHDVFWFSEYFMMPMPTGKKATNLREFMQSLQDMSDSVLKYHLWQSRLAIAQPMVEYPNDFAFWAASALHDIKLAEKLSSINSFEFDNLTQLRETMVELLEEYVWDLPHNPTVLPGFELYFCEAPTIVMRSGVSAQTLSQFCAGLQTVGLDSVYYHFIEARSRWVRNVDDFSYWIESNFAMPALVSGIRDIDANFFTLQEVRDTVLALVHQHAGETCDQSE